LAIAIAGLLAACSSTGGPTAIREGDSTPAAPDKIEYQPSDFLKTGYCPPLQIRGGTETLALYERGHDNEPNFVRYQASITKTARECKVAGNTLTVNVGVSGRVVAGPKGGPGTMTLPLRIVVIKQIGATGPLYSKLFKVPVTLAGPTFGADYSQVFDQVSVEVGPKDRDLIIYVGFDSGPA